MDSTFPYIKNEHTYRCAFVQPPGFGLAFNKFLSGGNPTDDLALQPLVFESKDLSRNASSYMIELPIPSRHKVGNAIAFADGHAKIMPAGPP